MVSMPHTLDRNAYMWQCWSVFPASTYYCCSPVYFIGWIVKHLTLLQSIEGNTASKQWAVQFNYCWTCHGDLARHCDTLGSPSLNLVSHVLCVVCGHNFLWLRGWCSRLLLISDWATPHPLILLGIMMKQSYGISVICTYLINSMHLLQSLI